MIVGTAGKSSQSEAVGFNPGVPYRSCPIFCSCAIFNLAGSRLIGLDTNAVVGILLIMVAIHLAVGALAGWLAWDVGYQLHARLGKTFSPSSQPSPRKEEKTT